MRGTFKAALLIMLLLPVAAYAAAQASTDWYVNMKYGFSIAYPKGLFFPQGESADGSGQKFRSKDGRAAASVYGYDSGSHTLTSVYNETLLNLAREGHKVAYKSIRGDAFIIHGTRDNIVFYKKVVYKQQGNRQFVSFEAVYDVSRKESYEYAVSSMAGSIRILHAATRR